MLRPNRGRRRAGLLAPALFLTALLTGCAGPSHADDAKELAQSLRKAAGVERVTVRYTEPITLDSGKVALVVAMAPDATADQVVEVVESTYTAFRTTHHDEEADLEIRTGDDVLTLRAFEPEATSESVVTAARVPLAITDHGAVRSDLMTQDVSSAPHVSTATTVTLDAGTTAADVMPEFDRLAAQFPADPLMRWTVRSADGAGLGTDPGYPTDSQIALWKQLRAASVGLGKGAAVYLQDFPSRGGDDRPMRFTSVEFGDADPFGDAAAIAPIVTAAQRQIDLTREGIGELWSYDLTRDDAQITTIDPQLCDPESTLTDTPNPVDEALRTPVNCPRPPTEDTP